MAIDPYESCPCGSGKKLKWCCADLAPDIEKITALLQSNQLESALKLLEKLQGNPTNPAYVRTLKAQVIGVIKGIEEGFKEIDHAIAEFPQFALAREIRADMLNYLHDYAESLDGYRDAQAHFAPDAVADHARTLFKIANCHLRQGRPIAAWASWQRALKLAPTFSQAEAAIKATITENPLLPRKAQRGLTLKSPDEFVFFNEDRQAQWDKALTGERDWQLEDVIAAFESLVEHDKHDLAAWYNLAIACAWAGENARAIEAMDQYVQLETDFEAAAEAWDLCEILRLGVGAEEYSDLIHYVALYEIPDPVAFSDVMKDCKNIVAMGPADGEERRPALHWMDISADKADPSTNSRPKHLAQLHLTSNSTLELVATSEKNLRRAREQFEATAKNTVTSDGVFQRPGDLESLDAQSLIYAPSGQRTSDQTALDLLESVRHHFEDVWLHEPLKSLGGVSPIDASQSEQLKKKVEGVLRFRERSFSRYGFPYNFDRLRNKLGLEPHETLPPDVVVERDVTGFSAAQLAELDPKSLGDQELVKAYRTAVSLEAETTALRFAEEMTQRDSIGAYTEMQRVFWRLIQARVFKERFDDALEWLDKAQAYDERNQGGMRRSAIDGRRAQVHLARGDKDAAVALFRKMIEGTPDRLEIVAEAVEKMLSAGVYDAAREFAGIGLERAERLHQSDFQNQFREYLEAAGNRA